MPCLKFCIIRYSRYGAKTISTDHEHAGLRFVPSEEQGEIAGNQQQQKISWLAKLYVPLHILEYKHSSCSMVLRVRVRTYPNTTLLTAKSAKI